MSKVAIIGSGFSGLSAACYLSPIVEHSFARNRALAVFKSSLLGKFS